MAAPLTSWFEDMRREEQALSHDLHRVQLEAAERRVRSSNLEAKQAELRAIHQARETPEAITITPKDQAGLTTAQHENVDTAAGASKGKLTPRRKKWYRRQSRLKHLRRQLQSSEESVCEMAARKESIDAELAGMVDYWSSQIVHQDQNPAPHGQYVQTKDAHADEFALSVFLDPPLLSIPQLEQITDFANKFCAMYNTSQVMALPTPPHSPSTVPNLMTKHRHELDRRRGPLHLGNCCANNYLDGMAPMAEEECADHVFSHEMIDRQDYSQEQRTGSIMHPNPNLTMQNPARSEWTWKYKAQLQHYGAPGELYARVMQQLVPSTRPSQFYIPQDLFCPPHSSKPLHRNFSMCMQDSDIASDATAVCPAAIPVPFKTLLSADLRGDANEFVPCETSKVRSGTAAQTETISEDLEVKERFAHLKERNYRWRLRRSYSSSALSEVPS